MVLQNWMESWTTGCHGKAYYLAEVRHRLHVYIVQHEYILEQIATAVRAACANVDILCWYPQMVFKHIDIDPA